MNLTEYTEKAVARVEHLCKVFCVKQEATDSLKSEVKKIVEPMTESLNTVFHILDASMNVEDAVTRIADLVSGKVGAPKRTKKVVLTAICYTEGARVIENEVLEYGVPMERIEKWQEGLCSRGLFVSEVIINFV